MKQSLSPPQEDHWNINFAYKKFVKFKFRLLLDFHKFFNDGLYN